MHILSLGVRKEGRKEGDPDRSTSPKMGCGLGWVLSRACYKSTLKFLKDIGNVVFIIIIIIKFYLSLNGSSPLQATRTITRFIIVLHISSSHDSLLLHKNEAASNTSQSQLP